MIYEVEVGRIASEIMYIQLDGNMALETIVMLIIVVDIYVADSWLCNCGVV